MNGARYTKQNATSHTVAHFDGTGGAVPKERYICSVPESDAGELWC